MKADYITKTLLAIIAVCLVAIVVQNYMPHNRPVLDKQKASLPVKGEPMKVEASQTKSNHEVSFAPPVGESKPVVESNAVMVAESKDPASEFNKIVKLLPVVPISVTNTGNNWGNGYIRVSDVKYDAQKTDSVLTPYVGFIIYKITFGKSVEECTTNEDWSPFVKTTFQWHGDRWLYLKSMITDKLETPSWDWVDAIVEGNDNINFNHNAVYRIFGDFIAKQKAEISE